MSRGALLISLVLSTTAAAQPAQPTLPPSLPAASRSGRDQADEQTEQFLSQRGFQKLAAEQLERAVAQATGSRRAELADRLAELYAQILSTSTSLDEQADAEAKAQKLLADVPEADSLELRLGLARAGYSRAEQSAERWRLRLVDAASNGAADPGALVRRFDDLARRLSDIADIADSRVRSLEKQEESAKGDAALITAALTGARRQRSMAHYFAAWSLCYAAELDPASHSDAPAKAVKHLGWLLGSDRPGVAPPSLDKVSKDLLAYEHIARAMIAMGVARSLMSQPDEALGWLDAVRDATEAPEAVRAQLFGRRLAVLVRAARWDAALIAVREHRLSTDMDANSQQRIVPLDVSDGRLVAVLALESGDPGGAPLAALAISDLLARNESGHVLELVGRFGTERFEAGGFVGHQVRALQLYDKARAAHAKAGALSDPTADPEAVRLYTEAADQFKLALDAPEHQDFPATLNATRMLLGSCWFSSGGVSGAEGARSLEKAADWYEAASTGGDDSSHQSEALWLAIRALDAALARSSSPSPALLARRDELIDRFINRFPGSERATTLIVRRAAASAAPTEAGLARLMGIPESDPQYAMSRRQAARMAYQLYRAATPAQHDALGLRFVEVAEPLLAADQRRSQTDPTAAASAAALARQILDVLLSRAAPDAERAQRSLDVLDGLAASNRIDAAPIQAELTLRKAQVLAARGQTDAAADVVDSLRAKDPKLAAIGDRVLFRAVYAEFSAAARAAMEAPADTTRATRSAESARRVVARGDKLVPDNAPDPAPSDAQGIWIRAAIAEAALSLGRIPAEHVARDRALALYRALVHALPRQRAYLRGLGDAGELTAQWPDARDAWAAIASATQPGSDDWFEARCRLIEATVKLDRAAAIELIQQQYRLYPSLGPAPWDARVRSLARTLGIDVATPQPSQSPPPPTKPTPGTGGAK